MLLLVPLGDIQQAAALLAATLATLPQDAALLR